MDWPSDQGIVVGLYGPWGYGKTSLLNLFTESVSHGRLSNARSSVIVRFTPAFYDDYAALVRSFFSTIARELGHGGADTEQVAKHMRIMGGFLAAATGSVQMFVPGASSIIEGVSTAFTKASEAAAMLDDGERTFQEARDTAERGLSRMAADGCRVVVLLDDLERLHRAELLNMLRLVRFVADLPNITVVLSMDDVRARSLLAEGKDYHAGDYGAEYLEKFIQVSIRVPPPEPTRFASLVADKLVSILQRYGTEMPKEFQPADPNSWFSQNGSCLALLLRMVKSPRDLARWSNSLQMLLLADEHVDVHPTDAALIAAVEVFHPDFYERIRRNRAFLTGERNSIDDFLLSRKDRAERTTLKLRDLVGEEGSTNSTLHTAVLEALFGKINEIDSVDDPVALSSMQSAPAAGRQIRIPAFFDRYFGYLTEVGALSQRSVLKLISTIEELAKEQPGEAALTDFFLSVFVPLTPEHRERLIADFRVHFGKLDPSILERIGRAAIRLPAPLEPQVAFRLFTSVLARISGPEYRISYGTDEAKARLALLIETAIEVLPSHFDRLMLLSRRAGVAEYMEQEDRQRLTLAWLTILDEDLGAGVELKTEYEPQTAAHILAYALEAIFELRYQRIAFTGSDLLAGLREHVREYPQRFVTTLESAWGPLGPGALEPDIAPKILDLVDDVLGETGFARETLEAVKKAPGISDDKGVLQRLTTALEIRKDGDAGSSK